MNCFADFEDVDLTIEEHHAHEAMGSSTLRGYLSDNVPSDGAAAEGNAVHLLAFEPQHEALVIERPEFKGKGAVIARREWVEKKVGFMHFAPSDLKRIRGMAAALRAYVPLARLLASPTVEVEHTVLAKTDTGLWVKARPDIRDHAKTRRGKPCRVIVDGKTTNARDDNDFAKSFADFGYDIQSAMYGDIEHQRHGLPVVYIIVAVQKSPSPRTGLHKVMELVVPEEWLDLGRKKYGAALMMAEIEKAEGERPPMHWEGARTLPPPPPWVSTTAERIREHGEQLAREYDQRRGAGTTDGG